MWKRIALVFGLVGCSAGPPPVAGSAPGPLRRTVQLHLSTAEATGLGRVAWAWLPAHPLQSFQGGYLPDSDAVALIDALQVTEPLELGREPQRIGDIETDQPGGFVAVFQRPGGDILSALFGGASAEQWVGSSAVVELDQPRVELSLSRGQPHEQAERCTGPQRHLIILESPEVAGEIGNETARRLCVMTPSAYAAQSERRFPVVYLLPGFGGHDTTYAHLADEDHEVILVGIDGRTRFGATYFRDTAYAGAWERFFGRVIETVDERFRTQASPRARGVLGHSTGGFNAMVLALRRPEWVTAAAASSPDGLDLEAWLVDEGRVRPQWLAWTRLEATLESPGQMVSYAVQFSDTSHPGAVRWPYDLDTGEVDDAAWASWLEGDPMSLLDSPERAERIRAALGGRLFLSVGRQDAFDLYRPAAAFHERLRELGIEHGWVPTDTGHFEGSQGRRVAGLAFLAQVLSQPAASSHTAPTSPD